MRDSTDPHEAITIEHFGHRFGQHRAVDDISLAVHPGECFGLLGPNGAGKTTMIRLVNTLLPLQEGAISIFGLSVRSDKMAVRRSMGYVPQQLSVEGALTARENVSWFARLYDVPRRERTRRVDSVLRMLDLTEFEDRQASTFSGGMVRRLELAQALVNRPALLVLDEPTVGLDPIARDSVWARVQDMRIQDGMTVLLTTHYMEEADLLCERVALMHLGELRTLGTPAELKAAIGPDASLEDVFCHHTGDSLTEDARGGSDHGTTAPGKPGGGRPRGGGLGSVRATRRAAGRAG